MRVSLHYQLSDVPHIPGPPLRKLIRSKATKSFLTPDGGWTNDIANAAAFRDHSDALAVKQLLHLAEVELYYSFHHVQQSQWDFTMKL